MRQQSYTLQKTMCGAVAVELALLSIPLLILALGAASFVFICDSINTESGCKAITNYKNVATGTALTPGPTINLVEVGISGYSFNFLFDPGAFLFLGGGEKSITFGDIRATMRQS